MAPEQRRRRRAYALASAGQHEHRPRASAPGRSGGDGRGTRPHEQGPQRSPWSATAAPARRRWPKPCCSRPARLTRVGRVEDGSTVCDFDPRSSGGASPSSLAVAPFAVEGPQGQPDRHPGLRRLRGRGHRRRCGSPTWPSSSSAPSTGSRCRPSGCGRRRPSWTCPAWSSSTSSTASGPRSSARSTSCATGWAPASPPLELPIGAEADFHGVADLLSDTAFLYDDGTHAAGPIPDEMEALEHQVHDNLVEGIVVADDDLLEGYLEGTRPIGRADSSTPWPWASTGQRVPGRVRLGHRPRRHRPAGRLHLRDRAVAARSPGTHRGGGRHAGRDHPRPRRPAPRLRVQDRSSIATSGRSRCSRCCRARSTPTITS